MNLLLLVFHLSLLFYHLVLPLLLLCKEIIYKMHIETQTHLQIIFHGFCYIQYKF